MIRTNPLHRPAHVISLALLSLLLLTAGMCRQAEESSPVEIADAATKTEAEAAAREQEAAEAARAAEAEEQERLARLAAAEEELAERQARLAAEEERLRRERSLQAEREQLAAQRAAAAERERQLAAREQELREQQEQLAQRQPEPLSPDPLPEPTGNYEGEFDEPWRDVPAETGDQPAPPAPAVTTPPAPATKRATVQAGEQLEVQTQETLSSKTARVGDRFSARLVEDLRNAEGTVVVPAGAKVIGRVTQASPYRRGGGPATLAVEFTDIVVSPTQTVGIRASFSEIGADRSKNRKKVVAGAVVGAILGHILGGDGSKNVIVGAAAGAAAGGAIVASAKDKDAEIPGGQIIPLQLEEVVTVEIDYGAKR